MISGPVLPKTRVGLQEFVESYLDTIEFGLTIVERDLELEAGLSIEVLARDAAGRPVLVFAVDPDSWRAVPTRVLAARAWVAAGAQLLARFVPSEGIDYDLPPRLVVVGFELSADLLQLLADVRGEVEVYQAQSLRVGGRQCVGVVPRAGAGVTGLENSYQPPSGVADQARTLSVRFLDVVRRLDSSLQVIGDRYSRRFSLAGSLLAELYLERGVMCVRLPGMSPLLLRSKADCNVALDHLMRRYLDLNGVGGSAADVSIDTPPHPRELRDSGTLQRLRESIDASQLSSEEYSVLGDSGSDDD